MDESDIQTKQEKQLVSNIRSALKALEKSDDKNERDYIIKDINNYLEKLKVINSHERN